MKTIPLVVHVIYNTPEQNISDAQILSQIQVLNQDYARTNADAVNTPSAFKPVATDTGIRFCLVKIIRRKTNVDIFTSNNDVKRCKDGGNDPLDVTKYMNIWICNIRSGGEMLLGYAEFPETKISNTYGIVVDSQAFGTMGTAKAPYNKGRTLTHEMAHALGVFHVFSESNNACQKTDYCNDIPAQSQPTDGCPTFPHNDGCNIDPDGIMFMNYMDYSYDACMNIFTKDQAKRMNAVLSIAPYNTLAETGCSKLNVSSVAACASAPISEQIRNIFSIPSNLFEPKNIFIFLGIIILLFLYFRNKKEYTIAQKILISIIVIIVAYFLLRFFKVIV